MLRFLRIKHLAVIDAVEVDFDPGLNVLTGETGAGLKDLSNRLIELHGQHEHQTLLDPSTHLAVIDTFGHLDQLLAPTESAFASMQAVHADLARVRAAASDRESRLDLVTFQL